LSKKDIIDICESNLGIRSIKQIVSGQKELWQVKLEIEKKRKGRKKKLPRIIQTPSWRCIQNTPYVEKE